MKQSVTISIRGTAYYSAPKLFKDGALVKGQGLSLRHEKNNPHDVNAVAVHVQKTGHKLGHIPRDYSEKYALLLGQGGINNVTVASASNNGRQVVVHVTIVYDSSLESDFYYPWLIDFIEASGVYAIRNNITGRLYIGSSKNLKKRIVKHFSDLRLGIHHNGYLQDDYVQYGVSAFEAKVLEFCGSDSILKNESRLISEYVKIGRDLYNLTNDGQGCGYKATRTSASTSISDRARIQYRVDYSGSRGIGSGCLGMVFILALSLVTPVIFSVYFMVA